MSPLSFLQTFPPSFWLCLPGFSSSFLIKMSPGPWAFPSLARSQLGNLPLQHLLAESGWSGSPFALLPLPSLLLGRCKWGWQSAETQPCRPGVKIRKKGSVESLGMKRFLLCNLWAWFPPPQSSWQHCIHREAQRSISQVWHPTTLGGCPFGPWCGADFLSPLP